MPKSDAGCWTCRLRHKKCDESLPVCGSCGMLEISCYYSQSKPEWMDNGRRQREMTQRLKAEVKRSANRRRSRRLMQSIAGDLDEEPLDYVPPQDSQSLASFETSSSALSGASSGTASGTDSFPLERCRCPKESSTSEDYQSSGSAQDAQDTQLSSLPLRDELELSFIMAYLDYVFPIMFPFYRPSIAEGGRSWLLVLAMKNEALCHTVISLTSYFFSVVPVIQDPAHRLCASQTWEQLQKQTGLAVKKVQSDLQNLSHRLVHGNLLESTYLLESILHLLTLEVITTPTGNWQIHLDAALVLFEQVFQYHSTNQDSSNLIAILDQMGRPSFAVDPLSTSPLWNTDQAAFRFFSAVLLVDDIISSTSLEHPPRLRKYHADLLTNDARPSREVQLQLEDFVGCQNWALLLVAEIAALDAWKKDMKKGGRLSIMDLAQRGAVIERGLRDGLARLDIPDHAQQRSTKRRWLLDVPADSTLYSHQPCAPSTCASVTRIWAYAAQTYLHVVLSGWQPANPEVRNIVTRTMDLFMELASPVWLRTLAWPFCVTGCLAAKEQEPVFREMVSLMGALEMFGTMRVALSIMEKVWQKRAQIDADSWDLAACLRSLGHRVLLV